MIATWNLPQKRQARTDTIVGEYRRHFGRKVKGQYWTMCGLCDGDGCELAQVVESGLIEPWQFHGVEIEPERHAINVATFPEAHWYRGDFYQEMVTAEVEGNFSPNVVNADTMVMPRTGAPFVADLLAFVSEGPSHCLFVANFVMTDAYGHECSQEDALADLESCAGFHSAADNGLTYGGQYYSYPGRGRQTRMGSFIFVKRA